MNPPAAPAYSNFSGSRSDRILGWQAATSGVTLDKLEQRLEPVGRHLHVGVEQHCIFVVQFVESPVVPLGKTVVAGEGQQEHLGKFAGEEFDRVVGRAVVGHHDVGQIGPACGHTPRGGSVAAGRAPFQLSMTTATFFFISGIGEIFVFVFPAFVGPQPGPGVAQDGLLHQGGIAVGDFELGQLVGVQGHLADGRFVVPAF